MTFSETELILTGDKIYHLDIAREHLADTIITVGDPDRVALVSRHFQRIEYQHHHRGFVLHTGYFSNKRISVLATHMGTQNIDIVLNELDALVNIDFENYCLRDPKDFTRLKIIRLGTSGALQESIPLNSIIISEHAIDLTGVMLYYTAPADTHDNPFLHAFNAHMQAKFPAMPTTIYPADPSLVDIFSQGNNCIRGITVTCPGFYAAQGRALRAKALYPRLLQHLSEFSHNNQYITNLEMETSTIYGLGHLLGHQCCSLNLILLNRITQQFSKDVNRSQTYLIEYALDTIAKIKD